MSRNIFARAGTIKLEIELPWEVAQLLVEHGPALLKELSATLAHDAETNEQRQRLIALNDGSAAEQRKRWERIAQQADREIRQGTEPERAAMRRIAAAHGLQVSTLAILLKEHRQKRRERQEQRRDSQILKLHLLGLSHAQIANRLRPKLAKQSVGRIIRRYPDLLRSLEQLEKASRGKKTAENCAPETSRDHQDKASGKPETERKTESFEERLAKRKALHRALSVQFYRQYRRAKPDARTRQAFFEKLAESHDFTGNYAGTLISQRRHAVMAYVQRRREMSVIRLLREGRTNSEIAARLKLHSGTVSRIVRQVKSSALRSSPSGGRA